MPRFERLSPEETALLSRRKQPTYDLTMYQNFLHDLSPGEWGRIYLEGDDSQRTIKRRLTTAGKQIGKPVKYRKTTEGQLLFRVVEPTQDASNGTGAGEETPVEAQPVAAARGGRRAQNW